MALRRKRGAPETVAGPGTEPCPMCGEAVPVGEDGRCDLGHRVRPPRAAFEATEPLSHVEVVSGWDESHADAGVEVPVAPLAGPAAAGLALGDTGRLDDQFEGVFDEPEDRSATGEDDVAPASPDDHDDDGEGQVDLSGELDW